jgi:signal peptidase II
MRVEVGPRQPRHERKDVVPWAGSTCLLAALDQVSKLVVRSTLAPGSSIPLLGDILSVTFIPNDRGFSWFVPVLPDSARPVFLLVRLSICVLAFPVYQFYKRFGRSTGWAWVASIGISAGTIGNVMDDLLMPYTTDFIQVFHSPSGNLADLWAFVGILALVVEVALQWRRTKPQWQGVRYHWTKATQARGDFFRFLWHYFGRKP